MMREANESYTQFSKKQMAYSLKHMIYCNTSSSSIPHSIVEYDLFVVNKPKYYPLNCYFLLVTEVYIHYCKLKVYCRLVHDYCNMLANNISHSVVKIHSFVHPSYDSLN